MPITLTNFSALFIRGSSLRFIVLFLETFDWKFTFLLALKDGKSGHTLKGSKNYTIIFGMIEENKYGGIVCWVDRQFSMGSSSPLLGPLASLAFHFNKKLSLKLQFCLSTPYKGLELPRNHWKGTNSEKSLYFVET